MEKLVKELIQLAKQSHYTCDMDTWYNCPLSIEGCPDSSYEKNKCNCGAEEHNKRVDEIAKELLIIVSASKDIEYNV